MENLKIFGFANKENQRVYGSWQSLIDKGFDKSSLSKFLSGQRKSINGYTDLIDFELLNMNYDTIVFNSRGLETVPCVNEFIRAKEIAQLENKDMILWQTNEFDYFVKRKSFQPYAVTILYQNLFQISFNGKVAQIKILSVAFYTLHLEQMYSLLFQIIKSLFQVNFSDYFVCSRLDYAIDIKYNFNIFNEVVKGLDFTKFTKKNLSVVNEPLGRSITYRKGHSSYILYDKVLEVFQGKNEKREIFEKIFNVDFNNAFDIQEYIKNENYIFRFEYRLDNVNDYLKSRNVNVINILFDKKYIEGLIGWHIENYSSFKIPEDDLYIAILKSDDFEIEFIEFEEDRYIEQEIENTLKVLQGYFGSLHAKMKYLDEGLEINYKGTEKVFEFIKSRLNDFDYFNKTENKYMELNQRKYK